VPHPYTVADAERFIAEAALRARRRQGLDVAVVLEGELVGFVGAMLDRQPRIGWWLGRPYWGQGLMTEAVRAVLAHLFGQGVPAIEAGAFAGNAPSLRIQEKLGFEVVGEDTRSCLALGQDLPHVATRLTRDRFLALAGGRERVA
jgi:RimJ/RimL family protein N-acetyltransferase